MKKALISSIEPISMPDNSAAYRVADVVATEFPVADGLFWVDCEDHIVRDFYCWDVATQSIVINPNMMLPPSDYVPGQKV